jgi:DNA-binding GntR family transcriptional regulator
VTAAPPDPKNLRSLDAATLTLLRRVAQRALEHLGAQDPAKFVEREMVEQFSLIAAGVPEGPDREGRLHAALHALLLEYDDK